jgi:two-component system NtrC family sensor kinase
MTEGLPKVAMFDPRRMRVSISTNLILSFLLIIVIVSVLFSIVGIWIISDRIVAEAQEEVRQDLNSAREIYSGELRHIHDVVHLTAKRFSVRDALISGDIDEITDELIQVKQSEGLDILTLTDAEGTVLLRTNNPEDQGTDIHDDALVEIARNRRGSISATTIVPSEELAKEADHLADQAFFTLIDTPRARETSDIHRSDGMLQKSVAPVLDQQGRLLGLLYGGTLINRNFGIVDTIKQTVYEDLKYGWKDIGTATIFQDDLRISTNVRNEDGSRAIGTRVSEEVYDQVVMEGTPWIGRAYVVNDWYITAYEPIRNIDDEIIGILYVGVLEQPYLDIQREAVLIFLAITLIGVLATMMLSYLLSRRISLPIKRLALASQEIAEGNLEARVEVTSNDELGDLAKSFNAMASSLSERDEQLKEFTKSRIMESERLALIGQLAANVAHELNNPLQGIVTYSHLLLDSGSLMRPYAISILYFKNVSTSSRTRHPSRILNSLKSSRPACRKPSSIPLRCSRYS